MNQVKVMRQLREQAKKLEIYGFVDNTNSKPIMKILNKINKVRKKIKNNLIIILLLFILFNMSNCTSAKNINNIFPEEQDSTGYYQTNSGRHY